MDNMRRFLSCLNIDKIDNYEFKNEIGSGKASTVCLYENSIFEKRVVKFLICPRNDNEYRMFKEEAELLNRMPQDRPSIPKAYSDMKQVGDMPVFYYMMEYIEGKTLSDIIKDNPLPWNLEYSLKMLYCITQALSSVALEYIVHRDLHPGNIIIRKDFDVNNIDVNKINYNNNGIVIMDFGCHRDSFLDFARKQGYSNSITESIDVRHIGAMSTWSPESLSAPNSVDVHHDIWSLGTMLYRFLSGKYPVEVNHFGELYERLVIDFKIDWTPVNNRNVHWGVLWLIEHMLSKEPENRLLHGSINNIIYAILKDGLLNRNYASIKEYLDSKGMLLKCPRCRNVMVPIGSTMCSKCGIENDPEDWLSPFFD